MDSGLTPQWDDITDIIRGLVVRADLHGGVQTIEFELADDYIDSWRWGYGHIGCNVYLHDNLVTPPVAQARIMEPSISEDGNPITAFGPWLAYMFNEVYNDTSSWTAAGQTGAQVQDILTNSCPSISTNQDEVDEPGTNNFPWQPTDNAYPGDLIPGLAALSDANNAGWYFWLSSAPLAGITPQSPIPWFKPAASIPGWYQCWREDMSPGGLQLAPSLAELANDIRVMYRNAAGAQHQTASATDADSIARYGLREWWDSDLGSARRLAARQYRSGLLAQYKDPQQTAAFELNTCVYDSYGGSWPLWRIIADFPVRFCVNDLMPDPSTLSFTLDNERVFITLGAEYDHDSGTLTIVPDTQDNRADAILARHRTFQ